jgi:nucleoside-diphosphate-sugar epimerase
MNLDLPARIETDAQLEELMTRPRPELVESIRRLRSPLLLLGASGKMGPSLAVLAQRAAQAAEHDLKIIAISRFSDPANRQWLESRGIETIACDLLDREAVRRLPDSADVVFLAGMKFGTQQTPWLTWAVNTLVPAQVSERYSGARIVALSTGNVYPQVPIDSGGATESNPLTPLGEYSNAAVARERMFEFFSRQNQTPMTLLRLNYAVELRYGVLVDLARKVWAGEPVDVTMGYFNCIWQGDANELILRSFDLARSPAQALNMTGLEILPVREVARQFGDLMERPVMITGSEDEKALLSNSSRISALLGAPPTPIASVIRWVAHWIQQGGTTLGKATKFEVRDGKY